MFEHHAGAGAGAGLGPVSGPVPDTPASSRDALLQAWSHWTQARQRDDAAGPDDLHQAWLALQCALIPGVARAVLVLGEPDAGPYAPVAFWPADAAASELLAEIAEQTLQQRQPLRMQGVPLSAVALPIMVGAQLHGLVALETTRQSGTALDDALRQLQWGAQGLEASLRRVRSAEEEVARERLVTTLDMMAAALNEAGFTPAAHAVATDLAQRLDCDRVSIGWRTAQHSRAGKGLRTEVVAISHSADFSRHMNLVRAIATAMDEAVDQHGTVLWPTAGDEVLVVRDHAALARQHGSDHILTIPFGLDALDQPDGADGTEHATGAFCFERPAGHAFSADDIALCQAVVALTSRLLDARRLVDRSPLAWLRDGLRHEWRRLCGPRQARRKLVVGAVLALLLVALFAEGEYRIASDAVLESGVRRVLIAPYDGYLDSGPARAGDRVSAGAVMATLDQRDLRLEYLRWAGQSEQYTRQYQEALAQHDRAQSNILLAQAQQARAQMELLAGQLGRATIAAPFDGVVVSGDLTQALGSAVKRGQVLFEVAPLDAWRVAIEVDEGEIDHVVPGQHGTLALAAFPGQEFALTVQRVTPVALARDGRGSFRVEASLGSAPELRERLRPGMEGVARIEAGTRKRVWIWTHRMVDWLRLATWSWT